MWQGAGIKEMGDYVDNYVDCAVVAVKQNGEVGLAYMKSFEIEEKNWQSTHRLQIKK